MDLTFRFTLARAEPALYQWHRRECRACGWCEATQDWDKNCSACGALPWWRDSRLLLNPFSKFRVTMEEVEAYARLPWWRPRRRLPWLEVWEIGALFDPFCWLAENVYWSFVAYCREMGMPRFVPPGRVFTPGEFFRAFWAWCAFEQEGA